MLESSVNEKSVSLPICLNIQQGTQSVPIKFIITYIPNIILRSSADLKGGGVGGVLVLIQIKQSVNCLSLTA
jgi:hypothetical protein